jgi:ATP-dependent Clp protease protease subunit
MAEVIYNKDERRINFYGKFNQENTAKIIDHFMELTETEKYRKHEDINLMLNSPGGLVTSFLALYDIMHSLPCKVNITAVGFACSCGAMLLASATGKRRAYKHTEIMIHELSYGLWHDRYSQNKMNVEWTEEIHKLLKHLLAKHTKLKINEIETLWQKDFYMFPVKALELGVIDEVL